MRGDTEFEYWWVIETTIHVPETGGRVRFVGHSPVSKSRQRMEDQLKRLKKQKGVRRKVVKFKFPKGCSTLVEI